jgi:hypothetical protein
MTPGRCFAPNLIVEQLGRAMVAAAKRGAPKRILEVRDIRELAEG